MSIEDRINEFNKSLLDNENICDIVYYVKEINKLYEKPIELSFMNELLHYVNEDTCCIPHELLVKYKVLSNDKWLSAHVKRLINQYDFIEYKEYLIANVGYRHPSGTKHTINYKFHPDAFKECLMRAKNTKIYTKYYILLERSIKYYQKYQMEYKNNQIQNKDNQIWNQDNQIWNRDNQIVSLLKEMNEINANLISVKEETKKSNTKFDEQMVETKKSNTKIDELQNTLNIIVDSLKERAPTPDDTKLANKFVIIKNDNNSYTVIRSQDKSVSKLIKNKNIINCIENENIPNSIYLWNAVKNELTKEKKIICNYNTFAINENNFSEMEFIQLIKDIFDKRMEYKK
jgi:hypothetical protein